MARFILTEQKAKPERPALAGGAPGARRTDLPAQVELQPPDNEGKWEPMSWRSGSSQRDTILVLWRSL